MPVWNFNVYDPIKKIPRDFVDLISGTTLKGMISYEASGLTHDLI